MNDQKNLDSNKADLLSSTAKSAVGWIPFAGPLLAELVQSIIPDQKIDRLVKYVKQLDEKLSKYEKSQIENAFKDENCISLFEEGFHQAARAITDERREYIASIMDKGIDAEAINRAELKHILLLLQELNDVEVIWLRFYLHPTIGGDEDFRNKHKSVLDPVAAYIGSDDETLQKAALQDNYKNHLERLGLIKSIYDFDRSSGVPEYDKFSGKPKVKYHGITTLGRMLLVYIDLNDESA